MLTVRTVQSGSVIAVLDSNGNRGFYRESDKHLDAAKAFAPENSVYIGEMVKGSFTYFVFDEKEKSYYTKPGKARAAGHNYYWTGKPCKHGHVDWRDAGEYCCLSCKKMWLKNNKPNLKDRQKWESKKPPGEESRIKKWEKSVAKVCFYCGSNCENNYHKDHYMPRYLGGENKLENIVIACAKCNLEKNHKHPDDFIKQIS